VLPSGIVSRWEPQWVDVSKYRDVNGQQVFNDGAEMLIVPLPFSALQRLGEKHKICANCAGGVVKDDAGRQELCPRCKGNTRSWIDPEVRVSLLRAVVRDWRGLLASTGSGDTIEVPYSEPLREALGDVPGAFAAVSEAAQQLAAIAAEGPGKG
jgi:hypothetical protein